MKIVIAPDSFKESLSALDVAIHIEAGFRDVFPAWDYVKVPVADGGEGTVEALVAATRGRIVKQTVIGPLGDPVDAFFGISGDEKTAVIEMAAASGLMLLPIDQRDPMRTTTYGVGELIRAALDLGARHFIIGIGGSATNDGGAGMAQALGAQLLDAGCQPIDIGGGALSALARIDMSDLDPRLAECDIEVACDVDNPLVGPSGASAIFGPQKGASPVMVRTLDDNLRHYAARIEADLGLLVADLPGGGAAGGLGAAMVAFLGARLRRGADIVTAAVGLDAIVADADLVITGEGRIDSQSIHGKTPVGVARVAKRHGKPVIGIAGCLGTGADLLHAHGIDAMFSVVHQSCTVEQALAEAAANVRVAARNIAAAIRIGSEMHSVSTCLNIAA
ncbi:glycerate kinase [Sphingobium lactosutens]|mgnify:CR=1 FL=1|uniref:glycerate kinase n=1 Tax=Sphingobium lactosutens TaxID=522773 RepID=UPI0015BE42C5|nr:glycerate kinase [Sphingobium lactosutens]NWK94566.1 glycerate kinase [Sphingobium lactosutens]